MQLYLEGIDFLHIFVAIRFGRQVVAVDSLNNIIYIELAVREDGELFYVKNEGYISIYIGSPDKSRGAAKTCPLTDTHRFPMIFLSHIKHKPR